MLGSEGQGDISYIIQALDWCVNTANPKPDIINMSLFVYGNPSNPFWPPYEMAWEDALNAAYNAGIVLVACSGNDAYTYSAYPAAFANVISVGGHCRDQTLYSLSNGSVDFVAPGESVPSMDMTGDATWVYDGTSFASPHAAGLLALQLQYARRNHIQPNNSYLWEVMEHAAKDMPLITNAIFKGYGKIWAAETNPPPASPTDGSIDTMAKGWPLNYAISYSNYLYMDQGLYPAYYAGMDMFQTITLTNNTAMAGNYPDIITNLDVTTTQVYYLHDNETNLPAAAVEVFPGILSLPVTVSTALQDTYAVPADTVPGVARTALCLAFEFASDPSDRRIEVAYPYAALWSVPPERPVLRIATTETNSVLLFWPTQAVNFALQSVNELGATNWVNVTNPPTLAGTNQVVELLPASFPAFFRLAR